MESQIKKLLVGDVATLPTETVEGYAVRLDSKPGILKLMRIKDRDFDSDKIFTLVPESKSAISKYVIFSDVAHALIDKFMPGELTVILPKNPDFHHFYYDHFDTIGIRIPDHPIFPELLEKSGAILLTSANPKGGTPKSLTGHLPSTIVDLTGPTPKIIRQGNLEITI
jgi:L-threonylcarbamoyladenylate synthase